MVGFFVAKMKKEIILSTISCLSSSISAKGLNRLNYLRLLCTVIAHSTLCGQNEYSLTCIVK